MSEETISQKGLGMIVATASNGVIGKDGTIPWHQPADLKYFKSVTLNKAILMGRKTWESLGRPLPKRRNIVLTRDANYRAEGAEVFSSLDQALAQVKSEEAVIIGGAEIYKLAFPYVQTLWWTKVKAEVEGDAYFPEVDLSEFELVSSTPFERDEKNAFEMNFLVYQKA